MPASAMDQYNQARKRGLACLNEKKAKGANPYLPVLDHYLKSMKVVKKKDLGVREILTDQILGTCHEGRTESFAANFMPLLDNTTEFASKWITLCQHATNEGLRDPILVYELFGRYFVEEGNKRVSVTKFLNNPLISAHVINLIVNPDDMEKGELYKSFLAFYDFTGIDSILMTKSRNYKKLLRILHPDSEQPFTETERKNILSFFYSFSTVLNKLITHPIQASDGDAFLIYLDVYGWRPSQTIPDSTIEKELTPILPQIESYPDVVEAALLTETELSERKSVLSLLKEPIKAALIQEGDPQSSSWALTHYKAFKTMAVNMDGRVDVKIYPNNNTPEALDNAFKEAIAWGAQVIFTSHPLMLQATNRYAAKYPKIKFLNCSLNPEATTVRSYYTRGYEIQFLQGIVAAAMSTSGKIGYIADYPIYGAIADINAFAIGVAMVRPAARVYLDWSTTETPTNTDFPLDIDMIYISGQDFDTRIGKGKRFGLFDVRTGKFSNLSLVQQKWSVFYTRIMSSILNRTYKADEQTANGGSINYWLGLSNGLIDVSFSDELPYETHRLIDLLKNDITEKRFFIFGGIHAKERGAKENASITMNDLARMDFLVGNIIGKLPDETSDKLIPSAEKLVAVHGLDELEPGEQTPKEKYTDSVQADSSLKIPADDPDSSNSGLVKVISSSVQAGDAEKLEKSVQAASLSPRAKHE